MNDRDRIMRAIEAGELSGFGDLGVLLRAFNQIGIPWDLGTLHEASLELRVEAGELVGRPGPLKEIHLTIPPNANEAQVVVFCFTGEGKFNRAYIENAEPLGYQVDPDLPDELQGGWLNATDDQED